MELRLSRLLLFVVTITAAASQRSQWLAVRDDYGPFMHLLQISPREEYWLRPSCVLTRSEISPGCEARPQLKLQISLWSNAGLSRAKKALQAQGFCRKSDRCRVVPFQAQRVAVIDQRGRWKAAVTWVYVAGSLPARLNVKLRLRQANGTSSNCSSETQPRRLTANELSQLDGLLIDVVNASPTQRSGRWTPKLSVSFSVRTLEVNDTQAQQLTTGSASSSPENVMHTLSSLRAEIKSLKRKLDNAASDVSTLKKANSVIAGKLNISSGQVAYPGLVTVNDCNDVKRRRLTKGVFLFKATGKPVVCSADGQLIALSRSTGDVSFERKFAAYERGFGNLSSGDHWVGLQSLSAYTRGGKRCVTLTLTAGRRTLVAKYSNFRVTDGRDNYRLLYDGFSGNISYDALAESKGQGFSTVDNDQDSFPGSCADVFKSGNWFRACHHANLFGPLLQPQGAELGGGRKDKQKTEMEGMCWRGVDKSEMCAPLSAVEMRVKRVTDKESRRDLVWSSISKCGCSKAKLQVVTVNETALYSLTAGGGGGGRGYNGNNGYFPGGRGAVVKTSVVLKKGTELGIFTGCGGRTTSYWGYGGDATVIADRSRRVLLAMAGGGGGGSRRMPGLHGRAEEEANDAWITSCGNNLNTESLLRYQNSGNNTGLGWSGIKYFVLLSSSTAQLSTGGSGQVYGGGGGGGYSKGGDGRNEWSPGGGGGSYCNSDVVKTCRKEGGQNAYHSGYVLVEKHSCP